MSEKDQRLAELEKEFNEKQVQPQPKVQEIDVYLLFKQIDKLREEGVPEEAIRAAFNEFMAERQGNFRIPLKRILKTQDSIPMMSQEDINKMYEDAVRKPTINDDMVDLLAEIDRATAARKSKQHPSRVKKFFYTAAYLVLKGPLSLAIWILKKLNPEDDLGDRNGGFGNFRDDS